MFTCNSRAGEMIADAPQGPVENDTGFLLLHQAWVAFSDTVLQDGNPSSAKPKCPDVQQLWLSGGFYGSQALQILQMYQHQIQWETLASSAHTLSLNFSQAMAPEIFTRFYRFVFHICREKEKRNVQVQTAALAWRLLLRGRFRLLDRWCVFVEQRPASTHVITEDTWRQVLDFSRIIHEDLSNYDQSSSWAVLLDEFVELLHAQHGGRSSASMMCADSSSDIRSLLEVSVMQAISPHCGSKRRVPEIDDVAQQLSNMPFCSDPHPSTNNQQHNQHHLSPQRQQQQPFHHQQQQQQQHDHPNMQYPQHSHPQSHQQNKHPQQQQHQHQSTPSPAALNPTSLPRTSFGLDSTPKRLCTSQVGEDGNTCMSDGGMEMGTHNQNVDLDLLRGLSAVSVHLPSHLQVPLGRGQGQGTGSQHFFSAPAAPSPSHSSDSTHQQCTGGTSSPCTHSGSARRILKSRRSNVNDMVKASISDALFND